MKNVDIFDLLTCIVSVIKLYFNQSNCQEFPTKAWLELACERIGRIQGLGAQKL